MAKQSSERSHSRAKHKARWRRPESEQTTKDDDQQAAWRKDYYRGPRKDIDPQSNTSWLLEQAGLDQPYRDDAGSYDYRQKKWDQSVAEGNPDMSWMFPELSDEQTDELAGGLERTLGYLNPAMYVPGWQTAQRPSQDERILSQLSPEDRAALADMHPDDADKIVSEAVPGWSPKMNPFPTSWMGTRERDGDKRVGALPHFIDQWNYSPWSTEDILSFIGPDSPDTVRRDIDAWKGGSSYLDRKIGGMVGVESEGPETTNPYVDPVEIGSLGAVLGVPGAIKRAAKGGAKAVSATTTALKKLRKKPKPQPGTPRGPFGDEPAPQWPRPGMPKQPLTAATGTPRWRVSDRKGVRNDINRAMGLGPGAALVGGAGLGGAALYGIESHRQKKARKGN